MQNTIKLNVVKNFKIFALVAVLCVLPGLAALVGAPFGLDLFNLDVDFVGGTTMHYALHKEVTADDISQIHQLVESASGTTEIYRGESGEEP